LEINLRISFTQARSVYFTVYIILKGKGFVSAKFGKRLNSWVSYTTIYKKNRWKHRIKNYKKGLIAYYVQTTMLLQDLTVTGPPVIVVASSWIRFMAVEVVELVEAAELM
jgi:hypothetical protein